MPKEKINIKKVIDYWIKRNFFSKEKDIQSASFSAMSKK